MSSLETTGHGRTWWRSLAELADSAEYRAFADAEFPAEAAVPADALSRRRFLQLMGASVALASLAGCRWPQETILPFASRPDGWDPGVTKHYATSLDIAGVAAAVLATSYGGRPVKIEGNPDHPLSFGAAGVIAQASVLELYDPDRSRAPARREGGRRVAGTWADFDAFARTHFASLRASRGAGLAILSEASSSPTLRALRRRVLAELPGATWYEYEPLTRDASRAGTAAAFGVPHRLLPDLDRARVIVDLDADLLGAHPAALRSSRLFAQGRRPDGGHDGHGAAPRMNRLYAVESAFSLTGAMADHRWAVPARLVQVAAARLAAELFLRHGLPLPAGAAALRAALEPFLAHPFTAPWVAPVARDLLANRGAGLVAAGDRQPAAVHALCAVVNEALGNRAARYLPEEDAGRPTHMDAILALSDALDEGRVDTLLVLGGNPAFDAPVDRDMARMIGRARVSVRLGLHEDETSRVCTWHAPRAHALEAWGDVRAWDGGYGVAQPLIAPLFDGRTPAELLSALLDEQPRTAHELVRETARGQLPGADFEKEWRALLEAGFLPAAPAAAPALDGTRAAAFLAVELDPDVRGPAADNMELVFAPDPKLFDGRFANNAWLQELPEPMTKLTWDNAALLNVATAAALRVKDSDVVRLDFRGRSLEMPVLVTPGVADWSVTVHCGQGRTAAGRVGDGAGCDVYRLRSHQEPWFDLGLAVTPTGDRRRLACTQEHHAIDARGMRERGQRIGDLVREATLADFAADPHGARHGAETPAQLWAEPHDYAQGHRWGMAIDLNSCTGCNACVVACQAENNVPVVGREQVANGREMHWLRVDRYFGGSAEEPRAAHQPVACVQCENAPCEQVCPVAATVHSHEGLNTMVYNRCVGTRYCSNNCPFKVRRFNFFNYHKDLTDIQKMGHNPEVTVRARGVMEKCTYCVQRIEAGKIRAKNERRPLRDGEIVPACAQTCPADAIVFGDLNDPQSRVARMHADARAYGMLAELNVRPRTAYLVRLRNPNPELAEPAHENGGH